MNISFSRAATAVAFCALLGGCTTEYLITKNDGTVIEAYGKPKVDEKTGMMAYRDSEGRTMHMQKDEVKQIIER